MVRNEIYNFRNKIIVESEDLILPNNRKMFLFKVRFIPITVSILPVFSDAKEVVLLKQYRPAIDKYIIEVPAGTAEKDENPEEVAIRELKEETGLIADNLKLITKAYLSPGYSTEYMYFFVAIDPKQEKQNLDETEIIETFRIKADKALELINNGNIEDAKTILILLYARNIGII
ncbi:MAG: NUDIX hydrolase [Caldisphaera sp.]|uniref:NUDIX hydrolase n=1 Tax=Caldisphaera sp. TaxID=2060322 RepID=UPI003D1280C9